MKSNENTLNDQFLQVFVALLFALTSIWVTTNVLAGGVTDGL